MDGLGGVDEVLAYIGEMGLVERGKSGVYGRLKAEMWRETVGFLENVEGGDRREERELQDQKRRAEGEKRRVQEWEGRPGRVLPKL